MMHVYDDGSMRVVFCLFDAQQHAINQSPTLLIVLHLDKSPLKVLNFILIFHGELTRDGYIYIGTSVFGEHL